MHLNDISVIVARFWFTNSCLAPPRKEPFVRRELLFSIAGVLAVAARRHAARTTTTASGTLRIAIAARRKARSGTPRRQRSIEGAEREGVLGVNNKAQIVPAVALVHGVAERARLHVPSAQQRAIAEKLQFPVTAKDASTRTTARCSRRRRRAQLFLADIKGARRRAEREGEDGDRPSRPSIQPRCAHGRLGHGAGYFRGGDEPLAGLGDRAPR